LINTKDAILAKSKDKMILVFNFTLQR
jgi:hypothetical protein